ncbi:uncharacterized protein LOC143987248 [Lithobates pipiens]
MSFRGTQVSKGNTQKGDSCSKLRNFYCDLCSANCTSATQLAQHFMGTKHKRKLRTTKSQEQNDGRRLSNFLKAHMEEKPIVGLEYVVEEKKGLSYEYSCQLCKVVNADLPTIVTHITDSLHTECYIKEHFTYLLPCSRDEAGKGMYAKVLSDAAVMIVKWQKEKEEIQDVLPGSDSKTSGASEDTPPSKPESGNFSHSKLSPNPSPVMVIDKSRESYRYNKMLQKTKSSNNDPPLAKRSRRSPGGDQDPLPTTDQISKHRSSHYNKSHAIRMDRTATQKLEFRTNDEFLEYLANFVISDDEDVLFIRTITQNCIKALTSFQEEDAERQKTGHQPEAPLEDTSRTAQEIPGILEDETESLQSGSETSLLKDNSNPPSDSIPKNEATDLFFNSIKNMDESEVVCVFQKLVATNPEFKDMDIPTVIRFLKDSGRLKKP